MLTDYKSVFEKVETALIRAVAQSIPEEIIRSKLEAYKAVARKQFTDDDYFCVLIYVHGIALFGQLLNISDSDIELIADDLGVPSIYRYYLTGSVCVGKCTAVTFFRSLRTHDEWLEEGATGMEKDPENVSRETQIQKTDRWVAEQWHKKNFLLLKTKFPGIDIIDRCSFRFTQRPCNYSCRSKIS